MDESATLAVGRQLASRGILQAFNDCCLAGPIVTDNKSQRSVELDCLSDRRTEGPYT
jgi:hypothetical protein